MRALRCSSSIRGRLFPTGSLLLRERRVDPSSLSSPRQRFLGCHDTAKPLQLRTSFPGADSTSTRSFSSNDFDEEDTENDDDDGSDPNDYSTMPWKGLLETPARAAWRVSDPPGDNLLQSCRKILQDGARTPKQLLRAHRKILVQHSDLSEFRERERRRIVNGKRVKPNEKNSIDPVSYGYEETLATLRHRVMPNHAIAKRVLEETNSLLGPDKFSPKRIIDFGIGCGSSSAAALEIFKDVDWIHGIDPSQPMRDCSKKLIEGLSTGSDGSPPPRVTFSTTLSADSSSSSSGTGGGNFDLALFSYTATELPDVMSTMAAAAILFEKLRPNGVLVMIEPGTPDGFNAIRSVRNMLLDCCPPDDEEFEWPERCHILAPCTHNGTCPMERHKRNFVPKGKLGHDLPQVITGSEEEEEEGRGDDFDFSFYDEEGDEEEEEVSEDDPSMMMAEYIDITSHSNKLTSQTDAFNASFCSFVHALPSSDINKRGEKFSYLVVQKRMFGAEEEEAVASSSPLEKANLADLLARAQDAAANEDSEAAAAVFEQAQDLESKYLASDLDELGLDLLRGDDRRSSMGRIIRAPIKKKGHVYVDYCAAPGRIIRSRVTKATSNNVAPGLYTAARKSRWGGYWPDTMDRIFSTGK